MISIKSRLLANFLFFLALKQRFYFFLKGLTEEAKIITHLTNDEKTFLYKVAKQLKQNPVAVEIGSYQGASSCFIVNGIKKKEGTLYCIDTWENQTMPEGEIDTYNLFVENTKRYKERIVPLRGWSHEMVDKLKESANKIDLLFIDGDHSYEACKSDWELYSPLLNPNAIVVFHDTAWADGVNKVIFESVVEISNKILELPNMQAFRVEARLSEK